MIGIVNQVAGRSGVATLLLLVTLSFAADADEPNSETVRFATDVVPILTKAGCNSGGCHGKATGQNGFKLSLLGFEPEFDYRAIVQQARGRRLFLAAADQSLLLRKAIGATPHGGGKRFAESSADYQVLRRWIATGAPPPTAADPVLQRIVVEPAERVLTAAEQQQLTVTAVLSDGSRRDVTGRAIYESNEPALLAAGPTGLVKTLQGKGLAAVMVRFGGKVAVFRAAIPFTTAADQRADIDRRLDQLNKQLHDGPLDRLLVRQWRRLGVVPSGPVSDAAFLRRASIDICGTLPTPAEIESYVADRRPDKRARLIDRLLDRPEYAGYFALKWAEILRNRGAGYSTRKQRAGTALLAGWIRDSLARNKPYDRFVADILTAAGSQNENPATVWYRSVRTLPDYVESVSQAFLGVRVQCAQCHHHPFERWSQADYYGLAAVFGRVGRKGGFADAEVPTNEVIYVKDAGPVYHPRTGKRVAARPLGGPDLQAGRYDDPRRKLAQWMARPDNPFFARTMVNRMWAHFLGRGIIHPIDDARSTNPPSNPELLDALARDFVASGYDIKQLIRAICNSYAYRLSATPNDSNRLDTQTYARFYPRRLTAEVLLDGISQVLDVPTEFSGGPGKLPPGTRALDLPDENVPSHFLDVFGRPARTSACECERIDDPALGQALELVNSKEIQRKLTAPAGYLAQLAAKKPTADAAVEAIWFRVLGRPIRDAERKTAVEYLESERDRAEAYRSLAWALLATNEFLFNH